MLLTRLALRARIATLVLLALAIIAGLWSITRLQVELIPDVDFPILTVVTFYPGADPPTVLVGVTEPVEGTFSGLDGLDTVRSVSSPNLSVAVAEFEFGTNMDAIERSVNERLDALVLPEGARELRVGRFNIDQFPVLQLSVRGDRPSGELQALVDSDVLPRLNAVKGVTTAEIPVDAGAEGTISRTNGLPSLGINVTKEPDENTVDVVNAVFEELESIENGLPPDIKFTTIANQAPDIQNSIDKLTREVALGAVLAILVIFAFLLSARPTFVASISIPASLLIGVIVMNWQGMSLNIITLGGLAISAGRVVDDSIVVMENVFRHIQRGEDRVTAALVGTREVAGPITVSTLTTIAVFAPLGFIGGVIGTFFLPFALTITYALLASLLVALTAVPVLASFLMTRRESEGAEGRLSDRLKALYTPALRWALGHRALSLAGAFITFIAGLALIPFIPISFLPGFTQNVLSVELSVPITSPPGLMVAELDEAEEVLEALRQQGVVDAYQSQVGGDSGGFGPDGGIGGGSLTSANVLVRLEEDVDAEQLAVALRADLAGQNRTVFISQASGGGPQSDQLELVLLGEDYDAITTTAERIAEALQALDGLINVRSDALVFPEGVAPEFANFIPITRVNGQHAVTISGAITAANTRAINGEVNRVVDEVGLPAGVELDTGGVFADMEQAFARMGLAMLIGLALVYLVMLVSQRSFITPLIIVFSVPLASIGALGGLFITQRTLGLPALMGILMLIGLVVTNAVVLIAFVDELRKRGSTVRDALIEGGRTRLRPILMTALTTSFVLVPLALESESGGGIIGAELATVIIGGLLTSTFLTLIVVPVIYGVLRRDRRWPDPGEENEQSTTGIPSEA